MLCGAAAMSIMCTALCRVCSIAMQSVLTEYNVTQLVHRPAISAMSTMQHNLHCNQCIALIVNMENPLQCLICSPVINRLGECEYNSRFRADGISVEPTLFNLRNPDAVWNVSGCDRPDISQLIYPSHISQLIYPS